MTNHYVWIGIAVGVFFAGIGIGYAVFINYYNPYGMMMQPSFFNQMMSRNPQFGNQFTGYMMNDPQLREQMYNSMFQNQQFMQGMMQNTQFQQQWMRQYATNSQSSNQGSMGKGMEGQGMMGSGPNLSFKTISTKDAVAAAVLSGSTQVFKDNSTIVFNSQNVDFVALSLGGEGAKNMTGTSLPSYAKDDSFVIGNLIDPTLVVKSGSHLNITVINLDEDMEHNLVITSTAPPYGYMSMHDMMNTGGIISMMPILTNESHDSAYEYSYSVTLFHSGTYWYTCTYPGHAEFGMYGKILVQ